MKFSEFAKMIHLHDKEGLTESDFVPFLISQIMEEPVTKADKQKELNEKYNPLENLSNNTLGKIFNGSRNISKKHARIIRAHLDKDKFDTYITEFNNDAMESFCATLKEHGVSINDNQVSLACADTFENIITDLVNGTSKKSSDNYSNGFRDGIRAAITSTSKRKNSSRISVICGTTPTLISSSCDPKEN